MRSLLACVSFSVLMVPACSKKLDTPGPAASASTATATATTTTASPATASAPSRPPATDVTLTCIESARASSEQKDHTAIDAFDENPKTAWNDEAPDGTNQWVEARLQTGTFVDHVEVGGGWSSTADNGQSDLWTLNSSFKTMKVTWEGGSADVSFARGADRGVKKTVRIGAVTSFVRFTATAVDRGKYKDLCLDDAIVYGSCPNPTAPRAPAARSAPPAPARQPSGPVKRLGDDCDNANDCSSLGPTAFCDHAATQGGGCRLAKPSP